MSNKSIIYVNFSPYENAGKILDFVLDNYQIVLLFSFNFHNLGNEQDRSKLVIYKDKKIIDKYALYQLPIDIPVSLVFLLLPIRSAILFFQILTYSSLLKRKYGVFDLYFTVNAFTAWTGNVLRSIGIVKKTAFWVWDYYPPTHKNKIITLMRWLYWQFDKTNLSSDYLSFLNKRLEDLRKEMGIIPKDKNYPIIPIGTNPKRIDKRIQQKTITIGIFGVQKKSQGLDLIFDTDKLLNTAFPKITVEIIGSGPDEKYFKKRAKNSLVKTKFYGFISDENKIESIISKWDIGIAPYISDDSNVTHYSDPSKIKYYFSLGIPVITTDVFLFSKEIEKAKAGIVINYENPQELITAIKTITTSYSSFQSAAFSLAQKYYYKDIYPGIFGDYNNART